MVFSGLHWPGIIGIFDLSTPSSIVKNDIFKDHNLYPYSGSIKEHFREHFNAVFIALMPFTDKSLVEVEMSVEDTLKQVKPIGWDHVVEYGSFSETAEINKALKSMNSVYEPALEREYLEERLYDLCEEKKIFQPMDGEYDAFSKVAIYRALKLLGKDKVILMDEFYEGTSKIDLHSLPEIQFAELILPETYYIFSEDKEILFTLDWESCFFLIASSIENLNVLITADLFEGFLSGEETTHQWEFEADELVQISKRSVIANKLNKVVAGLLIYSFLVVTVTLAYWFYYRFGTTYISEAHWSFRMFVFDYAISEIVLLTQFTTVIIALITSWFDKQHKKTYLLIGLLILEFILIGQLHIYKGP